MHLGRLPRYSQVMFGRAKTHSYTLRRAAAIIFALMSVLPLLLFTYTLYALDLSRTQVAQIGLGSAVVLCLIGFYIYSALITRLAAILRDLEAKGATLSPEGAVGGGGIATILEPGRVADGLGVGQVGTSTEPPRRRRNPFAIKRRPGAGGRGGLVVPGVGRISELKPVDPGVVSDLHFMWRAEAEPFLGRRVSVAVRNAPDPIRGILAQVAQDGVILDQSGSKVGISYTRLSAIEADTTPSPA